MRNFLLFLLPTLFFLTGCEDPVSVDLEQEKPRLVIEATGIQQDENQQGILSVRLTKTSPFFTEDEIFVNNAEVTIQIAENTFSVPPAEDPGMYQLAISMADSLSYRLNVKVDNQNYQATTQLVKTVPIDYVTQDENTSIDEDLVSINAYFTDPEELGNAYYFQFYSERHGNSYDNIDDQLFNGNQISTFYAEEFEAGDIIYITIQGISLQFDTYFSTISALSSNSGNPFSSAPAIVRGNFENLDNPDNFALGYFRISQAYQTTYTIE